MNIDYIISSIHNLYSTYCNFNKLSTTLPTLDVGNKVGNTGYIDYITISDLKSDFIMTGVDSFNREFITLCIDIILFKKVKNKDEEEEEEEEKNKREVKKIKRKEVYTIFDRYSDTKNSLAFGTCYSQHIFFDDSRIRSKENLEFIIDRIKHLLL